MFIIECPKCNQNMEYKSRQSKNWAKRNGTICRNCKDLLKQEKEDLNRVRKCPSCDQDIVYGRSDSARKAEKLGQVCQKCFSKSIRSENYSGLIRKCPNCLKEMKYKTVDGCTRANKLNDLCKSCSLKVNGIEPSLQCIEASIKANTGKIHTEETKLKKKKTWLRKYNHVSFLQSEEYKKQMTKSGKIKMLFGNSPHAWTELYNIPTVSIYKWLENKENISKEELINFCENYETKITDIENIISQKFNLEKWNKKFHPDLKYKPDFKLTDKIALNVDGLYWHSEKIADSNYHFEMRQDYERLGLRIIQFRSSEIFNKIDIIGSIIKNNLNQTENKIGARKTIIKKVEFKEAELFSNQNHIKGYKSAKHLGLYYNDELVSIMSYKLGKSNSEQFIKIERFCSKINTNVIGGFSKLLKAVQNETDKKLPIHIHYWVDLRYGTGDFLLNHGFKLAKETLGWEWTNGKETFNRLKCRANMDERKLSEKEHAVELKWYKIYDAGQRLYVR